MRGLMRPFSNVEDKVRAVVTFMPLNIVPKKGQHFPYLDLDLCLDDLIYFTCEEN